jgi:hypothetical protein
MGLYLRESFQNYHSKEKSTGSDHVREAYFIFLKCDCIYSVKVSLDCHSAVLTTVSIEEKRALEIIMSGKLTSLHENLTVFIG